MRLEELVIRAARQTPNAIAVRCEGANMSYGELDETSERMACTLASIGVTPHTRVTLWLDKSIACIAAMQAVLRLGAAYVPLDPASPFRRIRRMIEDCAPSAMITTRARIDMLERDGEGAAALTYLVIEEEARAPSLVLVNAASSGGMVDDGAGLDGSGVTLAENDLAYILYTSGSTGEPKGVCISHANAWAFVSWAAETIGATAHDRFSNHAPFHFDLSVFDLYVAFWAGARVSLIPRLVSYIPERLLALYREHGITIWYSVPSVLVMMMASRAFFSAPDIEPRVLIFAGEPFPMAELMRLRDHWRETRFFNFYGPTETNVCTAYEIAPGDLEGRTNVPIGTPASGDRVWLEDERGATPKVGEPGELVVAGPTVMLGYFGKEAQGGAPYRTGDMARMNSQGDLEFIGRRDHMVKVQGHRVELNELEEVLLGHPAIGEAAVAVRGQGRDARLIAFLTARPGERPSLLDIKQHCARDLPPYAIVARVRWLDALPRTGTGKLDRPALAALLDEME